MINTVICIVKKWSLLSIFAVNIYLFFGKKVFRQIVDIPKGTYCAPLITYLILYCYEYQWMAKRQKEYCTRWLVYLTTRGFFFSFPIVNFPFLDGEVPFSFIFLLLSFDSFSRFQQIDDLYLLLSSTKTINFLRYL